MRNFILANENAVYFECGFSCDNVIYLSLNNENFFITDSRYIIEASQVIKNVKIIDGGRNLAKKANEILQEKKAKEVILDPKECSVDLFQRLEKGLCTKFIFENDFSMRKRIIKNKDEVKILRQSVKEGEACFDEFAQFIANNGIGMSEKQLHFQAELIFKKKGNLGLSFSPIVAINENAAKPHALPSDKILKEGDLLLLDAGVIFNKYCSDRTRTAMVDSKINFKKDQIFKNKKQQKIYDLVLKAQENAIKKAKPGMTGVQVDFLCREVIEEAGYGKYFVHSTGHGVGLDIHELPIISSASETVLKPGMVFTIEPGIYIENEFGVRIEDMVLMTDDKVEVL